MKDFLRRVPVLAGVAGHEGRELHDVEVVNKTLLKICNITRPSVTRKIQINLFSSPENSRIFPSWNRQEGGMCVDLLLVG